MNEDTRRASEIAEIGEAITVLEGRLIAARHLRLHARIGLLESEKRRLEDRLAELSERP